MSLASLSNTAWMLVCRREARAFRAARRDVARTQARVLRRILADNAACAWGRRHGFDRIRDPVAYQRTVPLSDYEQLEPCIQRVVEGGASELTGAPIRRFERTSGSTGGEKLIPWTDALQQEYQRAIAAWMYDLLRNRPALRGGRAFWSVSPALPVRRGPSAIPIGVDDDTEYLGPVQRWLARRLLATPPALAQVRPLESFRYMALLHLLAADDLALISVWSPTFLTTLLEDLDEWQDALVHDLRDGTVTGPVPPHARPGLPFLRRSPQRADELRVTFGYTADPAERFARLWPRLALISCWTDASAAAYVPRVRALFPGVEIQPKGLLATEGAVSIPLLGHEGAALAVRSHFLEFQEVGSSRRPRLAHELEPAGRYRVILTTGGGLYRYQLEDEVEVVGFSEACPHVRFLGRTDATSDLVGEKLHERHARASIERALAACGVRASFRLLAPSEERPPRYRLFLEPSAETAAVPVRRLVRILEAALCENPYYAHAVGLGQLAPVDVCLLPRGGHSAWRTYERRRLEQGQRAGDVKPVSLDAWTGWGDVFARARAVSAALPRS